MIVRVAKDKANPYALIHNGILNDARLSWKARGIAAYLLSKPDDWRINHKTIAAEGPDGTRAVLSAMKELEEAGYLHRSRQQREDGRWESIVTLFEVPVPGSENAHSVPGARKPTLGSPKLGSPTLGFRAPILSTDNQLLKLSTDNQLPNVGSGASSTPSVSGSVGAPAAQNDIKNGAVGEGDAAVDGDAAPERYGLDGLSGECRRAAVRFMAIVERDSLTEGEYHVFWNEGQLGAKGVKPHDHDWLLDTIERDLAAGKLDKYGDDLGPVLKWRYNDKHKRDGEKGEKRKKPTDGRRPGETDSPERRKAYQL